MQRAFGGSAARQTVGAPRIAVGAAVKAARAKRIRAQAAWLLRFQETAAG